MSKTAALWGGVVRARPAVPFLAFAGAYWLLGLGELDRIGFALLVYVVGTLGVFWEMSAPEAPEALPTMAAVNWNARRQTLRDLVCKHAMGGPAAAAIYGLAIFLFGGLLGMLLGGA